jgi:cytoplasmic iron level regulating protein YaaA (DUF328/UPF0246 family)
MLVVISPAKKLDSESPSEKSLAYSKPAMLRSAQDLVEVARKLNYRQLADLMKLSDKLVKLNQQRYQDFSTPFTRSNAKQAALTFTGDTYLGLDASSFSKKDHDYAQDYLRILSGLYGVLRPLDLIQPYRLEMGVRLKTDKGKNLYDFWGEKITLNLNKSIIKTDSEYLLNCASNEYFKVIKPGLLKADVITPVFKQVKHGQARMLGMMAKRARGAMARHVIQNNIDRPEGLKDFKANGYRFQTRLSDPQIFEFHRTA